MSENSRRGILLPGWKQGAEPVDMGVPYEVCPGKGYAITKPAQDLFPNAPLSDVDLRRYAGVMACRSPEGEIVENASSGGVMTAIADYLLSDERVVEVVVTKTICGEPGPRSRTFIATERKDLLSAQGLKCRPVSALSVLPEIDAVEGKLAFIGTPFQIADLRPIQRRRKELRKTIPCLLGTFCGGYRNRRETDIGDKHGKTSRISYPDFVRITGHVAQRRCRLCADAAAELADIARGDAWIPRFPSSGNAWSLLTTRSQRSQDIVGERVREGRLAVEDVTVEEVKKSQEFNLRSKKLRQRCRRRLYRNPGFRLPRHDGVALRTTRESVSR